jgi:DNA modification methylase
MVMMMQHYKQLAFDLGLDQLLDNENSDLTLEMNGLGNQLAPEDKAFHDWYRFILSYPAHLVSHYITDFGLQKGQTLLDPFCGTGTTLVEAKLNQIESIGMEANPVAHFATSTKTNWEIEPDRFLQTAKGIAAETLRILDLQGINDTRPTDPKNVKELKSLGEEKEKLILRNSISPLPLHKALVLKEVIEFHENEAYYDHLRLALAKALVSQISNLHFGPEVGVGKIKADSPVVIPWLVEIENMVRDLRLVNGKEYPQAKAILADARDLKNIIKPASIDAVITSPPYPNEKDYTRTTRLESVFLDFIKNKEDLRNHKKNLVRSNTRGVYKEDYDDVWVADNAEIQRIANEIEKRRIELGKTSGFEKLYSRVTRLYFGGMTRHLLELRQILRPGAQLAYVVGDQASYLRVMIRTGQILAKIAEEIGYEVIRIDLFRKRFATATKQDLREEVVILKWKG